MLANVSYRIAFALLSVLVAACGSPANAPVPTIGQSPPAVPTATPAAAVPTAIALAAESPTAPPRSPAAASVASAVQLVVDSSASSASYRAREQLVGRPLPSEAVGTSSGVSGRLVLGRDGSLVADDSSIVVDLTALKSDESRRDNWIKSNTLQTGRFPTAKFVPREAQGLPRPLPTAGETTFQLLGDLTVRGVTRPVTWEVIARFAETTISGNARTNVNITDFGMTPPRVGPVLSLEDELRLELAFTAHRA